MYNPYPGYANSYPPPQYQPDYNQGYVYQGDYGYHQNPPPPQQQQQQHMPQQSMPPVMMPNDSYANNCWEVPTPLPPHRMYNEPMPSQAPAPAEPKSEAVINEMEQQKNQLLKQREEYVRKCSVLRRELEQLKDQKDELASESRSEREHRIIIKENERLQEEIHGKMKAILNVIEMLSSIIKDGKKIYDLEAELDAPKTITPEPGKDVPINPSSDWESVDAFSENQVSRTPIKSTTPEPKSNSREYSRDRSSEKDMREKRFNYTYYDTGMHWCRSCDVFPETAKEYLQHLHSKEHQETAKENEVDITPWHKLPLEPVLPSYDDAPKKRLPIKGLQFFVSAPSWYCKLCDTWIGDLHCASHHLKSTAHSQNYENFVDQNPHWETGWLKDREKAMGLRGKSDSDSDHKKKKRKRGLENSSKEKKKKKRSKKKKRVTIASSSSSSSESSSSDDDKSDEDDDDDNDKSKSIRVAMRNVAQVKSIMNEDMSKWNVLEKLLQEHRKTKDKERSREKDEDNLINQWMTIIEQPEKDKFEILKDRMKAKQEIEKAKTAEYERRRREKERQERESLERRRQREREEEERIEYERRRKDEEEYRKIVDKDRSQVRFRATREHYRRRRAEESDEDEYRKRHSRENLSPSRYQRDSDDRGREANEHNKSPASPEPKLEPKKKPPGPPSYKKLPFIGRMPLYKKKLEKPKPQEIQKEEYEPQRKSKFESGNLTKSFLPEPEVVCFPLLSSIPPIDQPLPLAEMATQLTKKVSSKENLCPENGAIKSLPDQDKYYDLPLLPPPQPPPYPQDDLSMLGISLDDITAQEF